MRVVSKQPRWWAVALGMTAGFTAWGAGCGPLYPPAAPVETTGVYGDIAEVRFYLAADGGVDFPLYAGDPMTAFKRALELASFRLVESDQEADLIALVSTPGEVNSSDPGEVLRLTILDRYGRPVEIIEALYVSDFETSHDREASIMVARLTASPRLAAVAAFIKQARSLRPPERAGR